MLSKSIGLYIHFPFCTKKCYYCDFYSITELNLIEKFTNSLLKEMDLRFADINRPSLSSIFFGGGTPSLLNPKQMEKIFEKIYYYCDLDDNAEISVECNPNSADIEHFKSYKSLGVNRLSIGVQSFNPEELKFLQRIHSPKEAIYALEQAVATFGNVNADFIYSVPGQTLSSLISTINTALSTGITHLSAYSLIFEEGTGLFNAMKMGRVRPAEDEDDANYYNTLVEIMLNAGFNHYEVSNYAKPGLECRHNLNYWHCGEYVAFGPSAHGYLNSFRYSNVRDLAKYTKIIDSGNLPQDYQEHIDLEKQIEERIFLELRADGFDLDNFCSEFEIQPKNEFFDYVKTLANGEFLLIDKPKLRLSDTGYYLCDEITINFLKLLNK